MGWFVAGAMLMGAIGGILHLWGISLLKAFVWLVLTVVLILVAGNGPREIVGPALVISPLLALIAVNPAWLRRPG